ncbi:MAG TPA: GspE/PulE family protein, partial [Verrucomicrobiae bacterium]|nr:GspE/PulE family protein [Verrucomicrobiae bacterium]
MSDPAASPLLALVKEKGLIDDLQYEEVSEEHRRGNKPMHQILADFGIMDIDTQLQLIAEHLGTEVVAVKDREFSPELIKLIPANTARMYQCVPIADYDSTAQVAFADPLDPVRIDELGFVIKKQVQPVVANPSEIQKVIERIYGDDGESFSEILKEIGADKNLADEAAAAQETDNAAILADLANEVPIVRFVNLVLYQAVQDRASDIHFEPFEDEFKIRYRVDGALYEMAPPPKNLALPVVSRIKVMSNLNISERRLPQDGRITFNLGDRTIDLRVSTLPTQFGESVVLRVLDRAAVNLELESLGFPKYLYDYVLDVIQRPNGIFVVTGPTGCGKTTTLYSCLRRVNTIDSKLLTAEDPVEYDIEGIMQVAINESVGMTFSKSLRSFLRQDPDIIMVGE